MSLRVLFLVPWPSDAASTRLRVEQYVPFLNAHGIETIIRPFMGPNLFNMVYERGRITRKVAIVLMRTASRLADIISASRADVVFIHREALPFGTTIIERVINALNIPIILDFDDAIYLPTNSAPNGFMRYLKRPEKVDQLIRLSRAIITGNNHLQRYAARLNPQVVVIPTPVDTAVYRPREHTPHPGEVWVGWMGSGTTSRYVDALREPLERLVLKHDHVRLAIIGGRAEHLEHLPRFIEERWVRSQELAWLHSFDIGLMPYPNNEWARGKCAFKALLYMSVGIPAVCSAVGVAEEIIRTGHNGYLAHSEQEWFDILDDLVQNPDARESVGRTGPELVTTRYSLEQHAPRLLEVLNAVASGVPVGETGSTNVNWAGPVQADIAS
jgi:glycosyltransferase involved in cell wall biosynthesis